MSAANEMAMFPLGPVLFPGTAVGTRRVAVKAWIPDDPYPRARVEDLGDAHFDGGLDGPLLECAEKEVRRCLVLKHEMEEPAYPAAVELDDDPAVAAWQLAAVAPLGELDHLTLLQSPSCTELLSRLFDMAHEEAAVLAFRLGSG